MELVPIPGPSPIATSWGVSASPIAGRGTAAPLACTTCRVSVAIVGAAVEAASCTTTGFLTTTGFGFASTSVTDFISATLYAGIVAGYNSGPTTKPVSKTN
jgi:hypothetical protein